MIPGGKPLKTLMILPHLPTLLGMKSAWMILALKIVAALGFMLSANLVILYAS